MFFLYITFSFAFFGTVFVFFFLPFLACFFFFFFLCGGLQFLGGVLYVGLCKCMVEI